MIISPHPQDSEGWHADRLGRVTASIFHRVVTAKQLKRSAQADDVVRRCVAEWIEGQPDEEFRGTYWTDRGTFIEPQAFAYFALETGLSVERCGFIFRDEARECGCSPDGLVYRDGEPVAGLELKAPKLSTHLGYIYPGGAVPDAYRLQVQGSLWVTGLPAWYFMSYHPHPDVPKLLVRVEPDEKVQAALDDIMPEVLGEIQALKERMLAEGVVPAEPGYVPIDGESDREEG